MTKTESMRKKLGVHLSWPTVAVFIYCVFCKFYFLLVIVVLHKLLQLLDIPD